LLRPLVDAACRRRDLRAVVLLQDCKERCLVPLGSGLCTLYLDREVLVRGRHLVRYLQRFRSPLITNDFKTGHAALITRYARRMLIENGIAEAIHCPISSRRSSSSRASARIAGSSRPCRAVSFLRRLSPAARRHASPRIRARSAVPRLWSQRPQRPAETQAVGNPLRGPLSLVGTGLD